MVVQLFVTSVKCCEDFHGVLATTSLEDNWHVCCYAAHVLLCLVVMQRVIMLVHFVILRIGEIKTRLQYNIITQFVMYTCTFTCTCSCILHNYLNSPISAQLAAVSKSLLYSHYIPNYSYVIVWLDTSQAKLREARRML